MSDSLTAKLEPPSVCDCDQWVRSACEGEAFYNDHEGKRYCVLHFPGKEKAADFDNALQRKLKNKDFNFRGAWFPGRLSFHKFDFDGDVDFSAAKFSAAASFSKASAVLYTYVGFARWEPRLASESDVASAKRDDVGAPLGFGRARTYSAAVLTFQRPKPRPATRAAQTVVLIETILGPVQAALLVLAIRRKFMR